MSLGQKILDGLKDAAAGNFARVHIPDENGKMQTWVRIYPDDDNVLVPRAQYEALVGLREPLQAMLDWADTPSQEASPSWITGACHRAERALAALRAAGIHEGEGK